MIDAKELRVGNWVYNDENNPVQIVVIEDELFAEWNGSDSNVMFIEAGSYRYSSINPIPLTPEILEKAGFINIPVANDVSYQQLSHDFIDIYTGDKNGICEVVFAIEDHEIRRVRYVHDFQNVFFALANQEINI